MSRTKHPNKEIEDAVRNAAKQIRRIVDKCPHVEADEETEEDND